MDFQTALRKRLLDNEAVRAIVNRRVDWVQRPQKDALPAVTLQVISDPRPEHLKDFDDARSTDVQVDCWAAKYGDALALARAVVAVVKAPATVAGKRFGNGQVVGQRDLGEKINDGTFVHRQSVDLSIWHAGD